MPDLPRRHRCCLNSVPTGKSQKHKRWWTSPKLIAFLCFVVVPLIGIQIYKQRSVCEKEELRILLIGKTGVGKSTTGNSILRKKAFVSDISPSSVTSFCEKASGNINGRKVVVIDSPGLFDTRFTVDVVADRIKLCIPFSAPGPHVFLSVIDLHARFTNEDEQTVEIFQAIFGKRLSSYTITLFTHGDKLNGKNIQEFISGDPKLSKFIKTCGGGYHVFNNKDQDPEQVIQLLDQIDKMVTKNGGEYYTTEMLQEAERAIEEEKQRILKENEAQRQKEEEELRKQYKGEEFEREKKKKSEQYEEEAREKAEKNYSSFFDILLDLLLRYFGLKSGHVLNFYF